MADLTNESHTSQPSRSESSTIPSTMTDNLNPDLKITTILFNGSELPSVVAESGYFLEKYREDGIC